MTQLENGLVFGCWFNGWEFNRLCKVFDTKEKAEEWRKQALFFLNVGQSNKEMGNKLNLNALDGYPDDMKEQCLIIQEIVIE